MDAIKRCLGCGDLYRQCANPSGCIVASGRHLRPGRWSRSERPQERRVAVFFEVAISGLVTQVKVLQLTWEFR
jgi:hypothetical protein